MIEFSRRQSIIIMTCVIALTGTYLWWALRNIEPPQGGPTYSKIEDGYYMGGSVSKPPAGTQAVLNLCESEDPYSVGEFHRWDHIPDAEPAPSLDWLRKRVEFVDEQRRAGRQIYVHCAAGISRAGLVTSAYFMQKNKWTRAQALEFIRKNRPEVNPNPAFMELLLEWENEVKRQ